MLHHHATPIPCMLKALLLSMTPPKQLIVSNRKDMTLAKDLLHQADMLYRPGLIDLFNDGGANKDLLTRLNHCWVS